MVAEVAGSEWHVTNDPSKPKGTLQKLKDVCRLGDIGWRASVALEGAGILRPYCLAAADESKHSYIFPMGPLPARRSLRPATASYL